MIEGVVIKKLARYVDERGWLMEVFRSDEWDFQPVMSYVSQTDPGVVRGPHEHVFQSDCFAFVGPGSFRLHLWDRREGSVSRGEEMIIEVGADNPSLVIIPPGVVHGYKCISDQPGLSLNFPDKLYRGAGKSAEVDEIRWETDPDSPYKID